MLGEQFYIGDINKPSRITEKIWGREKLITNGNYCGKIMEINKGAKCSLHYHLQKDECFLVLQGTVYLTLMYANGDPYSFELKEGQTIHIRPGVAHTFSGVTDAVMLEISTYDSPVDSRRITKSEAAPQDD